MKARLNRAWQFVLGILMSVLGFTGCEKFGLFRCEYGQPHADFKLLGDVKDATGKGIPGIRVVVRPQTNPEYEEQETWENDTLYSDAKGHFEQERLKHDWPDDLANATVKFEDVDGSANGSFRTKVLTREDLTVERAKKGDGRWYSGAFTVRADAVLEEDN